MTAATLTFIREARKFISEAAAFLAIMAFSVGALLVLTQIAGVAS